MSAIDYNEMVRPMIFIANLSSEKESGPDFKGITIAYDNLTGDYIMNNEHTHYFDCTEAIVYFLENTYNKMRSRRINVCLPLHKDEYKSLLTVGSRIDSESNFIENLKQALFLIAHHRIKKEV